MRLLHTEELKLTDFIAKTPPYAILSHTWAGEEVLFADLQGDPTPKTGWTKVTGACRVAKDLGYQWIWIDTCCIDKSSSAELSEAINSMFRWYKNSGICIAYLADAHLYQSEPSINGALERSRWFTRGWTLQELLAPTNMMFYTSEWDEIGSREDLTERIAKVTGIHAKYTMFPPSPISQASVAERMFWAWRRETTRTEDIAYCLLGIFDVNMPLIYGEGCNAFKRLQESIMQKTDDQSIFAWGEKRKISNLLLTKTWRSFLADHPKDFEKSANIVPFETPFIKSRIRVDHDGATIQSPMWQAFHPPYEEQESENRCLLLAPLLCQYQDDPLNCIALMLTCDRNRKPVQNYNSAPTNCYRLGNKVFLAPKRIWIPENLFPAFLSYKLSLGSEMSNTREICIIRKLPPSYQAKPSTDYVGESNCVETSSTGAVTIDLGAQIFSSLFSETFHLGMLQLIHLQRKSRRDITLILQVLYLGSSRRDSGNFPESKYLIYGIVNGGLHGPAYGIQDESGRIGESLFETNTRPHGAGIELPFGRVCLGLQRLGSGYSTDNVSIDDIRVTVSRDTHFDPNVFIVDIEEGGSFDSAEAKIDGYFEPLR
ncbi:Vegetative incompatibility protein HET-E-1 [Colletotrichum aenigma]|uniref:Vegetative incompatibility protein HET-E-1 n=1 Tax=Colletotrichum aenigma TaxID=1215731 RepID=UPI001872BF1D|nr:Vegetative incompatibility protein HET-E-1 [Colletotrichum aenigma]KAF5519131.1 Vegetative incompatibility protein HET-E-1 [Colletotrichum aenigma]